MINFIEPHNPGWKTAFETLKHLLKTALKDFDVDIQHVGSTPISGLYAKPILDIDIIIKEKIHLDDISAILERLGYKNKGEQGISGRFAFRQTADSTPSTGDEIKWQEHHLYVCYPDSLALKNHLLFRAILIKEKKIVDEYSQLKISLMNEENMTREKYTKLKTNFILKILVMNGLDEKELNEIKNANI